MPLNDKSRVVGQRVVVTGMAGAGKSTFSKRLAVKTGLPLVHLDLHSWKPGWERVPADELLVTQRKLVADESWIIDSNDVDEQLLMQRADTLFVIATPWWLCSYRAFIRGLRRQPGAVLPEGCEESAIQRISDEWAIVFRNFRNRFRVPEQDRALAMRCRESKQVYILRSTSEIDSFLA